MKNTRLGSEKISKLLWEYSIPAITGTLVYILYNIVDRIFISFGVGRLAIRQRKSRTNIGKCSDSIRCSWYCIFNFRDPVLRRHPFTIWCYSKQYQLCQRLYVYHLLCHNLSTLIYRDE